MVATEIEVDPHTSKPYALVSFDHAAELALLPAQGCFHCCNQTGNAPAGTVAAKSPPLVEVANRRGHWLPAVVEDIDPTTGTIRVVPFSPVLCTTPAECWLTSVRYASYDVPQCALYNAAQLPAPQFEFPVPWRRESHKLV